MFRLLFLSFYFNEKKNLNRKGLLEVKSVGKFSIYKSIKPCGNYSYVLYRKYIPCYFNQKRKFSFFEKQVTQIVKEIPQSNMTSENL